MTDWIRQRHIDRQIKAGIDNLQPGYQVQLEDISATLADGLLSSADVDSAQSHVAITRQLATEGPGYRLEAYGQTLCGGYASRFILRKH